MVPTYPQSNLALLVARILLAVGFVMDGFFFATNPAGGAGYIQSVGLPGFLVYPAIVALLGGGLMVLVGYQTRLASLFLAGLTVALAFVFHNKFSDMAEMLFFKKDLAIAGGFLALMVAGAGDWSVDGARGQE